MAEKVKVNYIYADAEEKYVKAVVLYAGSDNLLYYDETEEYAVNGADVLNFFLKGLVIKGENGYSICVNCWTNADKGNAVVIYYAGDVYNEASAPIVTEE